MKAVRLVAFMLCWFSLFAVEAQTKKKTVPKKTTVQKKPTTQKKSSADTKKPAPAEPFKGTPEEAEASVKDIVKFLEYLLNTLGDGSTSARDKAVIVTESYSKIFRDSKVQVEDDLDATRIVITNKDVPAYLKDVDFFFKDVKFEFVIDKLIREPRPDDGFFYKVALTRHLKGTTSEGVAVSNSQPRFIEVNYDPRDQSLKIVSIYTHIYNEKDALHAWWRQLSYEWQEVFKRRINAVGDSLDMPEIKAVAAITSLDLSGNAFVQDAQPLSQLAGLQVLNLSGTQIVDLSPLRNLSELKELDLTATRVTDLSALKYAVKMEKLVVRKTAISDIAVVREMPNLRVLNASETRAWDVSPLSEITGLDLLDLSATPVANFTPVKSSTMLTGLDISNTLATDLTFAEEIKMLKTLAFDSTAIADVSPLKGLENLEIVHMNATRVSSLDPLLKLRKLQRIYCDRTPIKHSQADAFRAVNPTVLVIFDSEDLSNWWTGLSRPWQEGLVKAAGLSAGKQGMKAIPSKEELATLTKIDSINIEGLGIADLEPLSRFPKLRKVNASHTTVSSLGPLRGLQELVYLDISGTAVKELLPVSKLPKLKSVKADNSKLEIIGGKMPALEKLSADGTQIDDVRAKIFLDENPNCLVIYKTSRLQSWWGGLPAGWKDVMRNAAGAKSDMTSESLHRLIEMETLEGSNASVGDLVPLNEFIRLGQLHLSGTGLTMVDPQPGIMSLKSLHVKGSPLMDTESLAQFTHLEDLDISNTPVENIDPLWKLKELKKFNCAGTNIKHLDALVKMEALEELDISNTNVNKLEALDYLPMKTLKCFNTKLSTKTVDRFKQAHPDCNVVYY